MQDRTKLFIGGAFGGYEQSGPLGRVSGRHGLEEFLEAKSMTGA